jgi:hypothetical protein
MHHRAHAPFAAACLPALVLLFSGCSSSGGASGPDGSSSGGGDNQEASSSVDGSGQGSSSGGGSGDDGSSQGSSSGSGSTGSDGGDATTSTGDAAPLSACVPAIPQIAWTSPYAGWSRGIPTSPSFFPIAVWLQGPWHAAEMQKLGINVFVGNNAGTDPIAASDLKTLADGGMYAIVGQDSVGLANVDSGTIVGWWMDPDEPDNAQPASSGGYGPPVQPSTLVTRYNAYKATDSTRPIYLGLGQGVAYDNYEGRGSNPPPESQYVPASDIIDFDIYPYNNCGGDTNAKVTCGQFWLNAFGVDRLHMWSNRGQAVWTDIETTVIGAGTTTGPTPQQTKSEVWLSIIHGANGIAYFVDTWQPSFREDGIFADATMVTAVTALNAQILSLAPELNSASISNLVTVSAPDASPPVDIMVKAHGTSIYVFSAVSRTGATTGSFTLKGVTGSGTAQVVGESRTVTITHGAFTDDFIANGVHIYQIDFSAIHCN